MKILVTGAAGLLGSAVAVRGAHGLSRGALDVTDTVAVERALAALQPDAVVFCAAIADVDRCAHDPLAEAVNVQAPIAMAQRVPTWLVSTNYVFDGPGPHHPGDPRRPVNTYGRQKARAEDGVLAAGGHVVRTGWLFGPGGRNFPSRLPELLAGGPVTALEDWPVQPTFVGDLAERLLELRPGVTHAIGRETTTWADFARAVAQRVGGTVLGVEALDLGPRPTDARLAPADLAGWSERLDDLLAPAG
ncbi:MAG: NAD(P)-dependent oxidoreductase [Proteobacteria bacterium]|nr:NAD(P)-dependent oxidoreductase [Pseudomonadota bacterium]MCP4920785.1 NAD(P)-dependent oxidoreductase [Pseudomonadota bacterium]